MKFLIDECLGSKFALWLQNKGYDVISVIDLMPGAKDEQVLEKAFIDNRILVTLDKDFGEMVFRIKLKHKGIILLRLDSLSFENKIIKFKYFLDYYKDKISNNYVVITENTIKIIDFKK